MFIESQVRKMVCLIIIELSDNFHKKSIISASPPTFSSTIYQEPNRKQGAHDENCHSGLNLQKYPVPTTKVGFSKELSSHFAST